MCVSLHPARFTDTIVGAFEDASGRRYLAYQNTAANLAGTASAAAPSRPRRRSATNGRSGNWSIEEAVTPQASGSGNAMILPIPDDVDNIEIIDTTSCPNFLKDIRSALTPRKRGGVRRGGTLGKGLDSRVRIVEFDVYTIVIAADARAIGKALKSKAIPDDRRPALNQKMIDTYARWYPGWAISIWCFNNTDARRAKPALIAYDPTKQEDPDIFFVPTLDAHDGNVPDLAAEVDVDHTIFVATRDMAEGYAPSVYYSDSDMAAGIRQLLPARVMGKIVSGPYRNGDVIFHRKHLKQGLLEGLRALPPGAPAADTKVYV
ncbi:MAG TPA: hypothetical protein V6D08_18820 [Candidatus Obscuribacterales bacterium]